MKNDYLLRVTPDYEADKKEILRYLASKLFNQQAAILQDEAFTDSESLILSEPESYAIYKKIAGQDIRRKIARNYEIFYFIDGNRIILTRILHGSQDFLKNY